MMRIVAVIVNVVMSVVLLAILIGPIGDFCRHNFRAPDEAVTVAVVIVFGLCLFNLMNAARQYRDSAFLGWIHLHFKRKAAEERKKIDDLEKRP